MAKLNTIKRILREDFEEKDQALVDKLAFPLNQFIEQVVSSYNKNFTIEDNLPFEIKSFNAQVDANGVPTTTLKMKTNLKPRGMIVINALSLSNGNLLPGAPFCVFNANAGIITITQITGLTAALNYTLTVMIVA